MFHIAICDDDRNFIAYLKRVIKKAKGNEKYEYKVYEYISGEEFVHGLKENIHFDLLILDMQLGGIDGDETAKYFRQKFPDALLVFCSGICLPTDKTFEVTPFRYLLKSSSDTEFIQKMVRILEEVKKNTEELYIIGHYRNCTVKVRIRNILYVENAKRGSKITVTPRSEEAKFDRPILVEGKLNDLGKRYPELVAAHNSYLVNIYHVQNIEDTNLVLDTGEKLAISRTYQKSFRMAFIKSIANKY